MMSVKQKLFKGGLGVIVVMALVGGTWYLFSAGPEDSGYQTVAVQSGVLKQTIAVTGKVESKPQLSLQFKTPGIIKSIFVKEGTTVRKDQPLAEIENDVMQLAVEQSAATLAAARAALTLRQAGASQEDIQLSKVAIQNAQVALSAAKTQLKNVEKITAENLDKAGLAVQNATTTLANAQVQYDQTVALVDNNQTTTNQNLANAYKTAMNNIDTTIFDLKAALTMADQILAVDQPNSNLEFRSYLGALDQSTKLTAENRYREVQRQYAQLVAQRGVGVVVAPADQEALIAESLTSAQDTKELMHALYILLSNSITGPGLPATMLENFKTAVMNTETLLSKDVTTLQTGGDTINTLKLSV